MIVREIILRCSNCHCGIKVEVKKYAEHDTLYETIYDAMRYLGMIPISQAK